MLPMLPVLLAAAALPPAIVEVQADPWTVAVDKLKANLAAHPGAGLVAMAERLDAKTVSLKIQSVGAGFKSVEAASPQIESRTYAITASTRQMMDSFSTITMLPPEATSLKVRVDGEMFSPSLIIPITKPGEKLDPGTVTMGLRKKE
ncbi:MAG: hypothetical protein IPQ13_13165 [Holophagaceae bacterium]|nr:hypothetical protein [Holophagaceae bacterium]